MAARKRIEVTNEEMTGAAEPALVESVGDDKKKKWGWFAAGAAAMLAVMGMYWYKTDSWPVAAMVNYRPIYRFEVDRLVFKSQGPGAIDGLITQDLLAAEIEKRGVTVADSDLEAKIEEVKKSLDGQDLEKLLADRGMTLDGFKGQVKLQLSLEKALASETEVASEEAQKYVKDNDSFFPKEYSQEKTIEEAKAALREEKFQTAIQSLITSLRDKATIWRFYATSASGTGQ